MQPPILLYGPTASGKSALALQLAERLTGAVINADSQQVYREWRVLTARPSAEDERQTPHMLYGHVTIGESYSVGRWLGEVGAALADCQARDLTPIVVGGTGLYFTALTEGLAPVPAVPAEARARAEAELARLGLAGFAEALAARDPETAAKLDPANPARLLRAWEVLEATGIPLARWQARTGPPLVPLHRARAFVLAPPGDWLEGRCETRMKAMVAEGALAEVEEAMARGLPWTAPGMKAVGARELARHLAGELTLGETIAAATTTTRRYAKRQRTWGRGRMQGWTTLEEIDQENLVAQISGATGEG